MGLQKTSDVSSDIDIILIKWGSHEYNADLLQKGLEQGYDVDLLLSLILNKEYSVSMLLQIVGDSDYALNLLLQKQIDAAYAVDMMAQRSCSISHEASIRLNKKGGTIYGIGIKIIKLPLVDRYILDLASAVSDASAASRLSTEAGIASSLATIISIESNVKNIIQYDSTIGEDA